MYTRVVSSKIYLVHMVNVEGKGYRQEVIHKFQKGDDVLAIYRQLQEQRPELNWNLTHDHIEKALVEMRPSERRSIQRKRKIEKLVSEAHILAQKMGLPLEEFFGSENRVN